MVKPMTCYILIRFLPNAMVKLYWSSNLTTALDFNAGAKEDSGLVPSFWPKKLTKVLDPSFWQIIN